MVEPKCGSRWRVGALGLGILGTRNIDMKELEQIHIMELGE